MSRPRRILGLGGMTLGLAGCPSPSIYGTARTTPVREFSNTVSVEGVGVSREVALGGGKSGGDFTGGPTLPTYLLRYGAWPETDVGFRIAQGALFGIDVKYNFLRGDILDLAFDPMFQVGYSPGGWGSREHSLMYAHLPLIIDLNLSDVLTLVFTPGGMYAAGDSNDVDGFYGRVGFALNARVNQTFALQPEVTLLRLLGEGETPLLLTGGLGFCFGALPKQGESNARTPPR